MHLAEARAVGPMRAAECNNAGMAMSGICFTYHDTHSALTVEQWAEVCMDERDHPAPDGLREWHESAMNALKRYRPALRQTEALVYDDLEGPVYFITGSGDIQMKSVKRYTSSKDEDGFGEWWGYCRAIGSAGPTFAYDLDFHEVLDVTLDVEAARGRYAHLR